MLPPSPNTAWMTRLHGETPVSTETTDTARRSPHRLRGVHTKRLIKYERHCQALAA